MTSFERRLLSAIYLYLVIVVCISAAAHCAERYMPQPEQRAEKYGCTIDEVKPDKVHGVMPAWLVHVWAEFTGRERWVRLFSARPISTQEPNARRKALADCDLWLKQMEKKDAR